VKKALIVKYSVIVYIIIISFLLISVSSMKINTTILIFGVLLVGVWFAYIIYNDSKKRNVDAETWIYLALIGNITIWLLYYCLRDNMNKKSLSK